MRVDIYTVAQKAPNPGETVLRLEVEDGVIVAARFGQAIVSVPEDEYERSLVPAGMHRSLAWEDDEMWLIDHWMECKL